jgi:two-component system, NarL family, response regulator LiaR
MLLVGAAEAIQKPPEELESMDQIRVVLVDDHRVVSRGVRSYLESFPDIAIVGIVANGEGLLERFDEWKPDVVVMDLLMPGGMDGIEATKKIRSHSPRTKVVALTASVDEARLIGVLRAGAIGYVRKDSEPESLLAAVRAAAKGHSVIDPALAGNVLQDFVRGEGDDLTEREIDVLRQLARGYTNREIAEALFISEETVKTHIGNILSKLHLAHRTQAVIYAFKHKLVSIQDLEG